MRRKIYDRMLEWKREKDGRTALLIEGTRRIGKSYIAEEFARNEYESYILIDFSKVSSRIKEWFDDYLEDIDTLLQNIQLYYKTKLTPRKSVIIFDEVQKCPRAREAIKTLIADHRFDYIETGSLISIKNNVMDIVIPSEEDSVDMYPMDFEEFMWAMGNVISMAFNARGIVQNEIYQKIMFEKLEINEGMLVENIVAQMLKSANHNLFFYSNYDKNDASNRMEIDFLIQKENVTSRHNISPIEVKSSANYTLTSMKKCIEKFGQYLSTPYVLHSKDLEIKDGITYLPLYMTPLL